MKAKKRKLFVFTAKYNVDKITNEKIEMIMYFNGFKDNIHSTEKARSESV